MQKRRAKAQELVGPSAEVVAYGSGVGKARSTAGLKALVVVYLAAFVCLFLLAHLVLIPGILVFILAVTHARPRRGVAVTAGALVVLHESAMDAQPNRVLFTTSLSELGHVEPWQGAAPRHVTVSLGQEQLRMPKATYDSLTVATDELPSSSGSDDAGSLPAADWYPDPCQRFELRYWDGHSWTEHVAMQGRSLTDPLPR